MDFAGSGIVHMCGGVGGLCGTFIMGPRKGRFEEGVDQEKFDAHNVSFIVLGTIILWFGWSARSACANGELVGNHAQTRWDKKCCTQDFESTGLV